MFHLKHEEEILFSLLASDSRRQSSRFIGFQMPHWSVCHCYLMAIIFLCVSLPSYGILSDSLFLLGHSHIRLRTHPTPVSVSHSVVSDSEPMDCSPPDSSVHGIFQANIPRILEQGAISFSRGSCQPRDQTWVSLITGIFFTIWATREALPTKVRIVKAMIFLVVIYRCESWTVKKAESGTIDAFELCLEKTARRSNQSLLKKNNPEYSLEGLMLKLVLATWCEELSRKRPWCWVRLMQGGE